MGWQKHWKDFNGGRIGWKEISKTKSKWYAKCRLDGRRFGEENNENKTLRKRLDLLKVLASIYMREAQASHKEWAYAHRTKFPTQVLAIVLLIQNIYKITTNRITFSLLPNVTWNSSDMGQHIRNMPDLIWLTLKFKRNLRISQKTIFGKKKIQNRTVILSVVQRIPQDKFQR